ncbi:hypothetical protein ACEPPN_000177 [Leptodophora sp. 'Broadleaf-Isolate-01']
MDPLYSPLDSNKDEIRLITLLPKLPRSTVIRCKLETKSLASLLTDHVSPMSSNNPSTAIKSQAIDNWSLLQRSAEPTHSQNHTPTPTHTQHRSTNRLRRFIWGDYAALSYVWGSETSPQTIEVNGHPFQVTQNLSQALETFSSQSEFREEEGLLLWVDAISINQSNFVERGLQVARMRDIYKKALNVIAWVGEEEDESGSAIALVQRLAEIGKSSHSACALLESRLRENPAYLGTGCWLALRDFVERPYWYRLWIMQEIIMGSSSLIVRCGLSSIPWKDFCLGITCLQEYLWLRKDKLVAHDAVSLGYRGDLSWATASLHLIYRELFPLSERDEALGVNLKFWKILDIANSAGCKDPRDKVYGLVGLMYADVAAQLVPNYTISPREVYTEVSKAFIRTYRNLDPIREGSVWGPTSTPSWVADWQLQGRIHLARIENALWGPAWLSGRSIPNASNYTPYETSGDREYEISFPDNQQLSCSGFIVDSISSLSARGRGYFAWDNTTIEENPWKSIYGDFKATSEALYRTLLADRVNGGLKAEARHSAILSLPSTFKAAEPQFKHLGWRWLSAQEGYYFRWEKWRAANRNFVIGDRTLREYFTDRIPYDAKEYDFTEVYACFDRTSQKRRFMLTEKGYMGWVPDNIYGRPEDQTRIGDLVAVIFGCSTPIVIRKDRTNFKVVGEAYVQGLMDGEAIKFLEEGRVELTRFTFS